MTRPKHFDEYGTPLDTRPIQDSPLFDGMAKRDAAIEAVRTVSPPRWAQEASRAILRLAATGKPFASDDVWDALSGHTKPPEPRALGMVFMDLAKGGHIRPSGTYRKSRVPGQHARPIQEWTKP